MSSHQSPVTHHAYAWHCRPCAGPVLWGTGESPYASSPGGLCACCGTTTSERIEYRPAADPARRAAVGGQAKEHLGSRVADPAAAMPPPPPPGTQLSLF